MMKLLEFVFGRAEVRPTREELYEKAKAWKAAYVDVREQIAGYQKELVEVEQALGKALGFPWYYHDPKNFPLATATDGVCVGECTAVDLAVRASDEIDHLRVRIDDLEGQRG